jgi:hypothetical protein
MTTDKRPRHRPRWEDQEPGVCWECGGFCLDFKGDAHGWRCRFCLDAYLDAGWARWEGLTDKDRARRAPGFRTATGDQRDGTDPKGSRGGGGLAAGRTTPAATAAPHPGKQR